VRDVVGDGDHLPALLALGRLERHVPRHHAHVVQAGAALHAHELQVVVLEPLVVACCGVWRAHTPAACEGKERQVQRRAPAAAARPPGPALTREHQLVRLHELAGRRHRLRLASGRARRPDAAQRVVKHAGEVVAVRGVVAARGQPVLLQRLRARSGAQRGRA
jgi:hypothetical protein